MFVEICLAVLTTAFVALVVILVKISLQARKSIHLIETDVHTLSQEATHLLHSLNEFVRADLHAVSNETCQLVHKLTDLSSDINNKSHSLNFLFKPLSFLSSKFGGNSSSDESPSKCETIPQVLKWIASSALLIKATREFIKKYEKRT